MAPANLINGGLTDFASLELLSIRKINDIELIK